eukprot:GHVR01157658.1.p1 GENE.GHVR01157658.1~~GHVR01157658.1.p1  ORF type:complete len:108 (+),score=10.86 GHVR01157658.1:236-559(+)
MNKCNHPIDQVGFDQYNKRVCQACDASTTIANQPQPTTTMTTRELAKALEGMDANAEVYLLGDAEGNNVYKVSGITPVTETTDGNRAISLVPEDKSLGDEYEVFGDN